MKLQHLLFGLLLTLVLSMTTPVFAIEGVPVTTGGPPTPATTGGPATTNNREYPKLTNPLAVDSIKDLLYAVVDVLIFIGVILAVFIFVFIGFKFVWSQGDPEALKDARRWFLYAVIGTAILISSKVIVTVIKNTLISAKVVDQKLFNETK